MSSHPCLIDFGQPRAPRRLPTNVASVLFSRAGLETFGFIGKAWVPVQKWCRKIRMFVALGSNRHPPSWTPTTSQPSLSGTHERMLRRRVPEDKRQIQLTDLCVSTLVWRFRGAKMQDRPPKVDGVLVVTCLLAGAVVAETVRFPQGSSRRSIAPDWGKGKSQAQTRVCRPLQPGFTAVSQP